MAVKLAPDPAAQQSDPASSEGAASPAGQLSWNAGLSAAFTPQLDSPTPALFVVDESGKKPPTELGAAVSNASEVELIKTALEKKRKMFLVTALEGARLARIEDNELYIEFAPNAKHLRDTLAKSENVKIIREVCQEVSGKEMGVRIAVRDQEANDALPLSKEDEERREKQRLREAAERNPVVQQVLRTFRGEIVDVQRMSET
jgi:hypothetical protein